MRYQSEQKAVHITVAELCGKCRQTGGLSGAFPTVGKSGLTDELFSRIKKQQIPDYQRGMPRTVMHTLNGIAYEVSGCADGVFRKDGCVFVDAVRKIRGTVPMQKPPERYLAPARLFAWLEAETLGLDRIGVRLTFCCPDGELRIWEELCDTLWLTSYAETMLSRAEMRAAYLIQNETEHRPSDASVPFPFSGMRPGQEMLVRESYRDICRGKRLFVQAPTGIGKTVSVLYPAVRALGSGDADKIFYLTAKSSTCREAFRAAKKLFDAGAKIRTVILYAKEQMCIHSEGYSGSGPSRCTPGKCPFARGYYDKNRQALTELLAGGNGYTAASVLTVARKYGICPYELSLDLSEYCDIIICDYNYVFDPIVRLRRYFGEEAKESDEEQKYLFLVDEAHNLADRSREMFSARLSSSRVNTVACSAAFCTDPAGGAEVFRELIVAFDRMKRLCSDTLVKNEDGSENGYYLTHGLIDNFCAAVETTASRAEKWKRLHPDDLFSEVLDTLLPELFRFLQIAEHFGKGYLTYVEVSGFNTEVRLTCLDPSSDLDAAMGNASAAILFSATLTPTEYFSDILGGGKDSVTVELASPFPRENLLIAAVDAVSTRFEDRDKSYRTVSSLIAASISGKKGNYMVYFPSYRYLEKVYGIFREKYPTVETLVQTPSMTREEKETFLGCFRSGGDKMRVGFCVLGGSFSEGVDLPGECLIGVIIVGVGLPGLSAERNILREYYDERSGNGYDYAYTYPGMNNVLQAVGRVIRTDTDRGIAVLIDDRYLSPQYRALYPKHWDNIRSLHSASDLADEVKAFWNAKKT